MFSGLSAFPLTPLNADKIDEQAFVRLIKRLESAQVDSICVLGSTGSYPYLTRTERARTIQLAIDYAGDVPVMAGIGALRMRDVLDLAHDAQNLGVSGVLLSPVSYQKLSDDEVFNLFDMVTGSISVPLCVYDNPATTQFNFSDDLHGRIAGLPNVASIKIPPLSTDKKAARERITQLRAVIPDHVTIGISGDAFAVNGLVAGCQAWYSVLAGLFPKISLEIVRNVQAGNIQEAQKISNRLEPLWSLFLQYGSLRVIATVAELSGLVSAPSLPLPVQSLQGEVRNHLDAILASLHLE